MIDEEQSNRIRAHLCRQLRKLVSNPWAITGRLPEDRRVVAEIDDPDQRRISGGNLKAPPCPTLHIIAFGLAHLLYGGEDIVAKLL